MVVGTYLVPFLSAIIRAHTMLAMHAHILRQGQEVLQNGSSVPSVSRTVMNNVTKECLSLLTDNQIHPWVSKSGCPTWNKCVSVCASQLTCGLYLALRLKCYLCVSLANPRNTRANKERPAKTWRTRKKKEKRKKGVHCYWHGPSKPTDDTRSWYVRLFCFFFFAHVLFAAIRDWVLIPIMIVMLLVGILRHHITMLITGAPRKPQLKAIRES